jgi:hypothetical protein
MKTPRMISSPELISSPKYYTPVKLDKYNGVQP